MRTLTILWFLVVLFVVISYVSAAPADPKKDDKAAAKKDDKAAPKKDDKAAAKKDDKAAAKDDKAAAKKDDKAAAKKDDKAAAKKDDKAAAKDDKADAKKDDKAAAKKDDKAAAKKDDKKDAKKDDKKPDEPKYNAGKEEDANDLDRLAQAYCSAKVEGKYVFAVRRKCEEGKESWKCSQTCNAAKLKEADKHAKKGGECEDALRIYTERKKVKGDYSLGMKTFGYGKVGCSRNKCGPNYCCCAYPGE